MFQYSSLSDFESERITSSVKFIFARLVLYHFQLLTKIQIWNCVNLLKKGLHTNHLINFWGLTFLHYQNLKFLFNCQITSKWVTRLSKNGKILKTISVYITRSILLFEFSMDLCFQLRQAFYKGGVMALWYSMIVWNCQKVNSYNSALKPLLRLQNSSKQP